MEQLTLFDPLPFYDPTSDPADAGPLSPAEEPEEVCFECGASAHPALYDLCYSCYMHACMA